MQRQAFVLASALGDDLLNAAQRGRGDVSLPAVPHPEAVDRDAQQRGEFRLRQIGLAPKLACLGHMIRMPFTARGVKRSSACMAEDQRPFRERGLRDEIAKVQNP